MDASQQKSLLARIGVGVGGIVLLAVAFPLIYIAVQSMLGIWAIGLMASLGFGAYKSLPLLGQKLENWILSARKSEARTHSREQLQNSIRFRQKKLEMSRTALESFGGQIGTQSKRLADRKRADPGGVYTQNEEGLEKAKFAYQNRLAKYTTACVAQKDYEREVDRYLFNADMGDALGDINKGLNEGGDDVMMDRMLADEAFKAIDNRVNAAFAALDLDNAELNASNQLTYGPGVTIDVQAIQIPTAEKVSR